MSHWGSRYVRSSSGRWFSVHGREGTMVTNRYGTTFYRSGSEVWRDITKGWEIALERELHSRTRKDFEAINEKFLHWGKIIRTMIEQGIAENNQHTQDLAEMLEAQRIKSYGPKIEQLRIILDETAIKS